LTLQASIINFKRKGKKTLKPAERTVKMCFILLPSFPSWEAEKEL